jgi:hypothetical protein
MVGSRIRTALIGAIGAVSAFAAGPAGAGAVTMSELMTGGAELLEPGAYKIRGRALRCGSAQTLVAPEFWDYGGSLPDVIIVNPVRMRKLPWRTQLFVYYHECAHQTVGADEVAADCRAIRTGKEQGWLRASDVERICTGLFIQSEGDRYHPPGPERCQYLRQCFAGSVPARYDGATTGPRRLDAFNRR